MLKAEIEKLTQSPPRWHRLVSMFLDHVFMTVLIVPAMVISALIVFSIYGFDLLNGTAIIYFPMILLYYNKDIFRGKSAAKRLMGYVVVDRKTNAPANALQCFIRNLTIAIAWPLEVLITLFSPKRRLGDVLANTKVEAAEKENLKTLWTDIKSSKPGYYLLVIIIICAVYSYGLSLLDPRYWATH